MTDHARTSAPRDRHEGDTELAPLALLCALLALALGGGTWVHQLALRDRAGMVEARAADLEARVARLDDLHSTDAQLERQRAADRAVLAGA